MADEYNHVIRRVSPTGATSTVAGKIVKSTITGIVTRYPGFQDGSGTNALFHYPYGVVADPASFSVYIADSVRLAPLVLSAPGLLLTPYRSFTAGQQRNS